MKKRLHLWLPFLLGVLMLPVPLLRDFHIESALLVSLAGCFWAAWCACYNFPKRGDLRHIAFILQTLALVGVPLFIFSLLTGCLSWHGIGFWILYPVPSVLFGYSFGRMLRVWHLPYRRLIAILVLLFIAMGVLLIEFFNFPQVYFFNHVWGGWPGPIYDETIKVGWSLIFFRGMTLAWAATFWMLPAIQKSTKAKIGVGFCALFLIFGYSHLAEWGIITPRSYLKQQLAGKKETTHFILYYDKSYYSSDEINFYAQKHEFYYHQIVEKLDIARPEKGGKIESYLYAHPWQKKALVGAKFTSYVPVWLEQDQLHIAKPQLAGSLKHELVHVLAKQFGNELFNASWSIGLIEGLAVAVAPDESPVSTIDQIVYSEKPYPSADEMKNALSPLGFYGGRSAVNYTQSGSFVRFLLNNYPVDNFKGAYRTGNISKAYQPAFDRLIAGWHAALDTVSVDSTDQQVAARLYGFPSLFEQECPHVQSNFARLWDHYQYFMAEKDTANALEFLNRARKESPQNPFVKNQWAFLSLKAGNPESVIEHANQADSTIDGLLLSADAFALKNQMETAQKYVELAADQFDVQSDSLLKEAIKTRQDSMQWQFYREIIYKAQSVADSTFRKLYARTKARAIQRSIVEHNQAKLKQYMRLALNEAQPEKYFNSYLEALEWLAFYNQPSLASQWLKKLKTISVRDRYRERLRESQLWMRFLVSK